MRLPKQPGGLLPKALYPGACCWGRQIENPQVVRLAGCFTFALIALRGDPYVAQEGNMAHSRCRYSRSFLDLLEAGWPSFSMKSQQ